MEDWEKELDEARQVSVPANRGKGKKKRKKGKNSAVAVVEEDDWLTWKIGRKNLTKHVKLVSQPTEGKGRRKGRRVKILLSQVKDASFTF